MALKALGWPPAQGTRRRRRTGPYRVAGLLTTVTDPYDRISMHGVRRALLEQQAAALGLTLRIVRIPPACPNRVYEERVGAALADAKAEGIEAVAFGDLFLEDIRRYREAQMQRAGMTPLFPVWGGDTALLARRFLADGFRATVVCCDGRVLAPSFAGRPYDAAFLADLPAGVDPCGENGEFHTFVHDGPIFARPIPVRVGDAVTRDGFHFRDLLPA